MSYELKNQKHFVNPTVGDVLAALMELPKDIPFYFCGADEGYLHVQLEEKPCCSIDHSSEDWWYEGDEDYERYLCEEEERLQAEFAEHMKAYSMQELFPEPKVETTEAE